MVAAVEPTLRKSPLSTRELGFCREFASNGGNAAAAYRVAYRYKGENADTLARDVVARSHIKAHLQALRDSIATEGHMAMSERRGFLAKVVRDKRRFAAPDAATRITAVREDAILAGERRTDGTQISIGGDLNISVVLQSLRAAGQLPASASADNTVDIPVAVVSSTGTETVGESIALGHTKADIQPDISSASTVPLLGPLGRVRGSGATLVSPGRQMPVESSGVQQSGASVSEPYVCEE